MKKIILFDSKRGTTKEIACQIVSKMNTPSDISAIDRISSKELDSYDIIILGAPAYAGNLRKQTKNFLSENIATLTEKRLLLFSLGLQFNPDEITKQINELFPKELMNHAEMNVFLGGKVDFSKLNFFERLIMKKILSDNGINNLTKTSCYENLKFQALDELINTINHIS